MPTVPRLVEDSSDEDEVPVAVIPTPVIPASAIPASSTPSRLPATPRRWDFPIGLLPHHLVQEVPKTWRMICMLQLRGRPYEPV
eukprot:5005229-Amphidinium_carterae.1